MKNATLFTLALLLGVFSCTFVSAQSVPTFTGNAAMDFLSKPGSVRVNDFIYDVNLPPMAPAGTRSGWDIQAVYFFHDRANDELYVGIDFHGIFGDADGDGNPSTTADWLADLFGTDNANLSNTEGFVLAFDNENDGSYDAYVGVSETTDINGFGMYVYSSDEDNPSDFPVPDCGEAILYSTEYNAGSPDLEFKITNISKHVPDLTDVNFSISAGSSEDSAIGEDNLTGRIEIVPLPVEMTDISAAQKSRRVQLDWTTQTEYNNDYFEVQHATDENSGFKSIGVVQGSGNSLTANSYTFFHDTPAKGNNYYRLRQVDFDGQEWISWVVSQTYVQVGEDGTIEVYPNPNNGEFMLGLPTVAQSTPAIIRVIDTKGAVVSEMQVTLDEGLTAYPVQTKNLPRGLYHVSLTMLPSHNTYNEGFMVR